MRARNTLIVFILVVTAVFAAQCVRPRVPSPPGSGGHLAPGNPSGAAAKDRDNYLIEGNAYALSYNNSKGIANWVAWRLAKEDKGEAQRQNDFRPDTRLPAGFTRVDANDYSSSGYERGHLCPSADRSSSPAINSETFLMTNIAPQVHGLNSGPWEKLERYSRSMARRDANLYIIAGQYGTKGKIDGRLTIPSNFWKVIVVIENGGDISAADPNTRVIAVDMPNDNAIVARNWREFTVTVRSIEEKTGYDLLSNLSRKLQDTLETKADPRSEK